MSTRTEPPSILHENQQDNQQVLRTVSPSRSFGTYDRYIPPRSSTSYRDDYTYRASSWRPNERPVSYYNSSPSPSRYDTRELEDPWTRSPYSWQDRRSSEIWGLDRRRDSGTERSFEPSELWKQSHNDWRVRQDPLPPHSGDRYLPNYSRDSRDYNQTPRSHASDHYSPLSPSGDRYRPYPDQYDSREIFSYSRPDSYRPQYDDDGSRGPSYASSLRGSRIKTPDEEESPRRESRPAYIHRLPISHADRESRHYSPTRPISPRDGRSSSPTAVRLNNGRNNKMRSSEFVRRASIGRRSRSPARSIKHEHSPPIPGLVGTKSIFAKDGIQEMNLLTGYCSKRRNESPFDNEIPRKRARSISPQSSIASSRQSSPAPIIVIAKTALMPSPDCREKSPYRNNKVPENVLPTPPATSPPQEDVQSKFSNFHTSFSPTRSSIPGFKDSTDIISETLNINTVPMHVNQDASLAPASSPSRPLTATMSLDSPEILLPAISSPPTKPSITTILDGPTQEDVVEVTDVSPQQEEEAVRPEIIRHSTSYNTKSIREALKHVVMTRHLHDHHRRNERVEPILLSNLSTAERFEKSERASSESLFQEVLGGACQKVRRDTFEQLKPSFEAALEHRHSSLSEKVQRLRSEYLELHQRWMEYCSKLDEAAKTFSNEDAVATSGRTTRRSAAIVGDAVRSDLEMEQIIASLGNEDLTDANHLAMRNAAIIPDMISVTRDQLDYLFDDTNNWVEDPAEFYAQRTGIDDWTEEEKEIFSEQYAAYPKQFGTISEMLPNKTTAQCVAFYYLHKKKHIDFRKVIQRYAPNKRRGGRKTDKQRGNALLSDIRKHDAETGPKDNDLPDQVPKKRRPGRPPGRKNGNGQLDLTPTTTPTPTVTPDPDPVPVPRSRGGRRLNLRTPVIIEDVTEEEEEPKPAKKVGRRARKQKPVKPASSEEVTPAPEYQDVVGRRKTNVSNTQWPEEDQKLFIELVAQHGDNFKRIAASMPNKTTVQVSIFYNANRTRLDLDKVAASAPHRTPTPPSSSEPAPPQAPAAPAKSLRPRDRIQDARRAVLEYPGSGVMSPYRSSQTSSPPPRPMYSSDQRQDPSILLPQSQESSWPTYGPYHTQAHSVHQNYTHAHPSIQRQPYFHSQQIPYTYHHHHQQPQQHHILHPSSITAESVPVQGDSFFINDYQHSRGPPQPQSSSMGVIPGLMNINVPDFDPQYHQPVIRVQHQDSHHDPPTTSSFMTGRVLLSTKAYYSGRS